MKFACKCLNFLIDTNSATKRIDESIKRKLSSRANDAEDLVHVTCESVVKKVDILIGTISYDGWTEYYCRNCGVWMYCSRSHEDHNVPAIVNSSTQVDQVDIENRKKDSNFSRIFKILIFNVVDLTSFAGMRNQAELENLHPVASSWLERETTLAENLIKEYTYQQYAELESKRMRAYNEQAALRRVVSSDKRHSISPLKLKQTHSAGTRFPIAAREGSPQKTIDDLDLDDSVMFESKTSNDSVLSEVSDDEGQDVSYDRRAMHVSEPMLARSLPIPVPQFFEDQLHDDRHERSPQTPVDIAANIKALARSVHGNRVFGDLPRPRFTKD